MSRRALFSAAPDRASDAQPLWVLNGLPAPTAREVESWIEQVGDLPLDSWIRIADRCSTADQPTLVLTRACKRIERVIADQGLQFTAWLVRDLVDGATHRVRLETARQPRRLRARLSMARMAAEWAALAKACRPWLSAEDHDLLCAAFDEPSARRASVVV